MPTIEEILSTRADYSSFLIHLTRRQAGRTARQVLQRILRQRRLRTANPYCLFINQIEDNVRQHFNVVCFTEAPLQQIKAFIGDITGRRISLEPYGVVFTKDFIAQQGGNPAFYINTYHRDDLRKAVLRLFRQARRAGFAAHPATPLLPFVNIFGRRVGGGRYDFYWEREWKVVGDVTFRYRDVVVGLCPEDEIEDFEQTFRDLTFISPFWGLDRIIAHLHR